MRLSIPRLPSGIHADGHWILWLAMAAWMLPLTGMAAPAVPALLRYPLARGPLVLESPAAPDQHLEALGEQAGVWGSLAQGVEAWVYPFKLLDGGTLFVATPDGSFTELSPLATRHTATPHMAQIEHAGPGWRLTATWFVPRSQPGLLLLLDLDARHDLELALRFRPSLAPMHLKAGQPLESSWEAARRELVVREPSRRLAMRMQCPWATAHRTVDGGAHEIRFTVPHRRARHAHVPIAISLEHPAQPDGSPVLERLLGGAEDFFAAAMRHYADLLARAPRIETPDPAVNDALRWSAVSLDQLRVHNPYLGHGLVSGYSSSGQGTRPRYCWFFEEPTLTSCAHHWLGLSDHIRESLRFLQRYQRDDGKTVHEIVQSLPFWTNYFREFPYAYRHSDGPVYYLFAYGHYYRATGDLEFIREEWPRIRRTLDWCLTAMDPADGLMRIEPGDWGSAESSIEVWKDTQLQGIWVRALRETARLAGQVGETNLATRCQSIASQAAASIQARLWDEEAGTYLWGLDRTGRPLRSLVPHHAVSFWLGSFPPERVERALERMAAADFRTDWGVRSLALSDPKYAPANYQAGSVWPVWNAGVIISDYRHQRGVGAYRDWQAMVRARTLDALGPMPEVLDGGSFRRLAEGVPHQMFSELAVVNGFFDGLLGLQVDVPARWIDLAPTLPPTWNTLKVARIPCGQGLLGLRIRRDRRDYRLDLDVAWRGGATVVLAPNLPAGARLLSVTWDGRPVSHEVRELPAATQVRVTLPDIVGRHTLRLRHTDGIEWLPADTPLVPGAVSGNLRVIRAGLDGLSMRLQVEGIPGRDYPVDFFTDRVAVAANAGTRIEQRQDAWRATWTAPAQAATNLAGFVRGEIQVRFGSR